MESWCVCFTTFVTFQLHVVIDREKLSVCASCCFTLAKCHPELYRLHPQQEKNLHVSSRAAFQKISFSTTAAASSLTAARTSRAKHDCFPLNCEDYIRVWVIKDWCPLGRQSGLTITFQSRSKLRLCFHWNISQIVGLGFMWDKLDHTWLEVLGTGTI